MKMPYAAMEKPSMPPSIAVSMFLFFIITFSSGIIGIMDFKGNAYSIGALLAPCFTGVIFLLLWFKPWIGRLAGACFLGFGTLVLAVVAIGVQLSDQSRSGGWIIFLLLVLYGGWFYALAFSKSARKYAQYFRERSVPKAQEKIDGLSK